MTTRALFPILMIPVLAACGSGTGGVGGTTTAANPVSSSVLPVSNGLVQTALSQQTNNTVSRPTVGTVAYTSGLNTATGQAVAAAGISGTPNVGAARTTGTASYTTDYEYDVITNVTQSTTTIGGNRVNRAGTVQLNANFDNGTLTGGDNFLVVNGTVAGSTVGGNVRAQYLGAPSATFSTNGALAGQIGQTGVIGTFHGTGTGANSTSETLAGGIVGVAN
ncbi:MAG: hypothetical protein AB3N23_21980 [Paracoccaceae bacterium]